MQLKKLLLFVGLLGLFTTAVTSLFFPTPPSPLTAQSVPALAGVQKKWHPLIIDFEGPFAHETDDAPNPFLDYRLEVTFVGPNGRVARVPGFFAGDGHGNGSGNVWRVIFSPDKTGHWQYSASFRAGTDIAVDLDPLSGSAHSFDGQSGSFDIAALSCDEPGFLRWGRLTHADSHYYKFADGGYWLKGGSNSPENFLGYAGFDNTFDQGGLEEDFLHYYADHVADWQPGDPNFVSADTGYDGKGIIGALNYLAAERVNAIYFLPMNLGGDGQETYPFVGPAPTAYDKTHYDISKLHQWGIVLEHAQNKGIALQIVLSETESENEQWFDDGELGVERKLFYRELIARFSYLLALQWNLAEENDFMPHELRAFADYIRALDWAEHPISVHTVVDGVYIYDAFMGQDIISATSIQYSTPLAGLHVKDLRARSATAGHPLVLSMDENIQALTHQNSDELRRSILYPVYFSGGNIEWYMGYYQPPLGGDSNLEDFRTREAMWRDTWHARRFMIENLPFWQMEPQDHLLQLDDITHGRGELFALPGQLYAIYLPTAGGQVDLTAVAGPFELRWYDVHTGQFVGQPVLVAGGQWVQIPSPPSNPDGDWVILLEKVGGVQRQQIGQEAFLPIVVNREAHCGVSQLLP